MSKTLLRITLSVLFVCLLSATAFAQARGRGNGRFDRGRDKSWKCGVFVNCHDARDGRLDGRGPGVSRNRNNVFTSRGARVGYRPRYNINDYWQRRHATSVNNGWRYRSRSWRYR
jgi:hypothetical protein